MVSVDVKHHVTYLIIQFLPPHSDSRTRGLKGRERAIVNQTNIQWNRFKGNVGGFSEAVVERIIMGFTERVDTILN